MSNLQFSNIAPIMRFVERKELKMGLAILPLAVVNLF